MDGEVRFTIRDESGEEQEIKVGISSQMNLQVTRGQFHEVKLTQMIFQRDTNGSYFGELALITDKPRAATVYAVGPTTW